jgi:hypothetical protein
MIGRKRRQENFYPQKNNSIRDLLGNGKSEYPAPDPSKTMINVTHEFNDAHKKVSQ